MKTSRPSDTALVLARSTVLMQRDPRFGHFVPPLAAEASRWFLESSARPTDRFVMWAHNKPFCRWLARASEQFTVPGFMLHCVLRKRYLEETVRHSLSEGFRKVVVLGAGFDTLALRLHVEFSGVQFLEFDHPATQQVKQSALAKHGFPGPNLKLLPLDFSQPNFKDTIQKHISDGINSDSLFIAEGLLMYLPSEVVASILHFVGTQPSLRTRIVFTFLDTAKDGHPGFGNARRTLNLWLRWRGEPFVWGIEKQKLADYLKTQGLFLQTSADHAELRQRYLTAAGTELAQLAEGECIGVADKL